MNRVFLFKVMGIFFLTILMAWAISIVNSLIQERQARQADVKLQIARSSAGEQTIIGPMLVIPYTEKYFENITENGKVSSISRVATHYAYVLPENVDLSGGFTNEFKRLGIYKALMYQLGGNIKGNFKVPAELQINRIRQDSTIKFGDAFISVGIADPRGIKSKPVLRWGNQELKFQQGSQVGLLGNGIHADIGQYEDLLSQNIPFEFQLTLGGMESFSFTPIAENNTISLQSSWQHPHFNGSFLPDPATQSITPAGFSANWVVSSLSSSNQANLMENLNENTQKHGMESLSVGFVEPINVYSQSDRATKYGLLFIGLTFAGFFVFEILKRLRIHPAQYTLVGLAMALFYLLLISLSEHISFAGAYLVASIACVGLLGYYLTHVLKSKASGMSFAGLLTALYGALYGILASEDNALLMGSLLVFGLLALAMVITRKVDWYQIGSTQ